ncbi:MAG: DUF2158 domain-containing protein [Enterobacteriaceae bacterium]
MNNSIKKGSVVELKSGGPSITVYEIDNGNARCVWFLQGEAKEGCFAIEALDFIRD